MVITDRQLVIGEQLPRGWGVAWYMPERRAYKLLPWGINWVAGWLRRCYFGVAAGARDGVERQYSDEYNAQQVESRYRTYWQGYKQGQEDHAQALGMLFDNRDEFLGREE